MDSDDCTSCGHPSVAHEEVVREGKAWFALDCYENNPEEIKRAEREDRLVNYCGHCMDECPL